MAPRKKNHPKKSYQFKLLKDERLDWFQELTMTAARKLLEKLWSEEWLTKLGTIKLKAYKVINEAQVELLGIYLPSRVRRGIAEWAGRIIRGQYKRMSCYYDCLVIMCKLGFEVPNRTIVAAVRKECQVTGSNNKPYPKYEPVMVEHTVEMIKNFCEHLGIAVTFFTYTEFVKPKINKLAFPFGPDDNQTVKYHNDGEVIQLNVKLPICPEPRTKSDWEWIGHELTIPEKIQTKVKLAASVQSLKPTLRTKKLKGGLDYFFLQFPWEYHPKTRADENGRTLAVDLGLKKVATIVVFEDGKQISRPIFVKFKGSQYRHVERLYNHIGNAQRKLAKLKKRRLNKQLGVTTYVEERRRLYEKRNRLGEELAHTATNILIELARKWYCRKIVIEDLRNYKPPRGKRSWSRRLSYWLRGRIAFILEYKSQVLGIKLQKVCPWNTSSHCPRCTSKGMKVKGPNNLVEDKCGRFFHCPECGFTADRDYIAALNIYRACFINYQEIKSLKDTSPVPYTDSGIPHSTVPSGGSEMSCNNNLLVAVTGKG